MVGSSATGTVDRTAGELASATFPAAQGRSIIAAVVALSLFGPYLVAGIRTEQVVLYGASVTAVLFAPRLRLTGAFVLVAWVWFTLLVFATVGLLDPPPPFIPYGDPVAGVDNLATPLVAMVVGAIAASSDRIGALRTFAATVAYLLAANALLAAASVVVDFSSVLQHFWTSGEGISVAEKAAGNLRYGGIFNQPAEAGTAYGFGLVLALWRWGWSERRMSRMVVVTMLLTVGGLLSLSKVFLLLGLPVFVIALTVDRQRRIRRVIALAGAAGVVVSVVASGIVPWAGQDRLQQLLVGGGSARGEQTLAEYFSAGRLGDHSTLFDVASVVWATAPVAGYGARGLEAAYDSSWLHVFVVAGGVGVALLIMLFVLLALRLLMARRSTQVDEWRLAVGFMVIAGGASFGLPVWVANRVAAIFWIVIVLTILPPMQATATVLSRQEGPGDAATLRDRNAHGPSRAFGYTNHGYGPPSL